MIDVIKIEGKEIKLKASATWIMDFKAFFGYEPLGELFEITTAATERELIRKMLNNITFAYQLLWVFAYNADETIETDLRTWLSEFSGIYVAEVYEKVIPLALKTLEGDLEVAKKK